MSASASKKRRKEELLAKQAEPAKKEKKSSTAKKIILGLVAALVAVALIITIGMLIKAQNYKTDFDVSKPVMKVGSYEVTAPIYNYFYRDTVYSDQNFQYAAMIASMNGSQQAQPLSAYVGEEALAGYITSTNKVVSDTVALAEEAKNVGYKLSADEQKTIDDAVNTLKDNAKKNGYSFFGLTYDWFCYDFFGPGCTVENYREYLELRQYAIGYLAERQESFAPTAEELDKEYNADPLKYDKVSFSLYTVKAEIAEGADAPTEEAIADAEAKAKEAVESFPEEGTSSVLDDYECIASDYSEDAAKWLFDAARKEGDVSSFTTEDKATAYVIRFDMLEDNDYHLVNVNIVTVPFDTEEGAHANADTFRKFCDGAKDNMTEEEFTKLVSSCGLEVGSNTFDRHVSVDGVTEFCFDEARKEGDILTVSDEEGGYYYIIRYIGAEEETYRDTLLKNALFSARLDELYLKYPSETFDDAMLNTNTDPIIY